MNLYQLAADVTLKVLHERPASIESIVGLGFVNTIFRVTTSTGDYIVRLNTDDDIRRFTKEAWCARQAAQLGIPSPMTINCGEIPGAVYMVQPFIEGKNGSLLQRDKLAVWHRMGEYARKFHNVPVVGFGENLVDEQQHRFSDSWQRFVTYNIDSLSDQDPLRRMNLLTLTTSDQLRGVFETLLDTPFTFGVCHGDLSEKNVLLHPNGEVYLLDWGCAEAHIVPHFELFTILSNHVPEDSPEFQAFLQGYGLSDFANLKPQIEMIKLLTFVDKLRWAIDRSPENIEAFAERARQQIAVAFL